MNSPWPCGPWVFDGFPYSFFAPPRFLSGNFGVPSCPTARLRSQSHFQLKMCFVSFPQLVLKALDFTTGKMGGGMNFPPASICFFAPGGENATGKLRTSRRRTASAPPTPSAGTPATKRSLAQRLEPKPEPKQIEPKRSQGKAPAGGFSLPAVNQRVFRLFKCLVEVKLGFPLNTPTS